MLLLADDVGIDRVGCYGEHPGAGPTPNIDRLAGQGVLFRNAYVTPQCSPTRATLLTGRYPFRHGVGSPCATDPFGLRTSEWTIPRMLDDGTHGAFTSVVFGKWHLGDLGDDDRHPLECGFDHHLGSWANVPDYFAWSKLYDGRLVDTRTYATTDTVNDALKVLPKLREPWFAYVAFNSAHLPYHAPPDDLHSFDLQGLPADTPIEHNKAMVEALDHELGRLLTDMPPDLLARTHVIFLGDNGTNKDATEPPWDPAHAKGTTFEGGIRVPLIVMSPRVTQRGAECDALVGGPDTFATIAELAGIELPAVTPNGDALDALSYAYLLSDPGAPTRRFEVYSETFAPNGFAPPTEKDLRAIRDPRWKLVRDQFHEREFFYDLSVDPLETNDLLARTHVLTPEEQDAHRRLKLAMHRLRPL